MNIIEAIKSGKRFRRKGQIDWRSQPVYEGEEYFFNLDELVADDWEVEGKKVTITAEELEIAFKVAIKNLTPLTSSFYNILRELTKELGL